MFAISCRGLTIWIVGEWYLPMPTLFDPIRIGAWDLRNRIIMAPLTRCRASEGRVPNELMAEYYRQRAGAGMIISEATSISAMGVGYPDTPGIWSDEQVEGWKLVTRAVHEAGGLILLQLWHVGRISDPIYLDGKLPVAPSAIAADGDVRLVRPKKAFVTPRALELDEIPEIVEQYRKGAANAKAAGFDGVEIHGANGYLLDQFLEDKSNKRTDAYGGSIENRARLLMEVADAVVSVWGKERVGVRLSPYGTFLDMGDSDPIALFGYVLEQLSKRGLAYAHLVEPRIGNAGADAALDAKAPDTAILFRKAFSGVLISAGGYTAELAEEAIAGRHADAVAFGRLFLANPDLPKRFELGAALNAYDRTTFYGGTEKGYTDYPAL